VTVLLILRCTERLQRKLGIWPAGNAPASTTVLGDWYGNIFNTRSVRLVMFVSERSRLSALVAGRDFGTLAPRFQLAVVEVLKGLGIPRMAIENEQQSMRDVAFASTRSRSVLATMNDYFKNLRWSLEVKPHFTLAEYALDLSETPVGPLNYVTPGDLTRKLFSSAK
jgi:uncharacterized protein DUF6933